MAVGTEVGDAFISIHADTTRFRAELSRLNRVLRNSINRNNDLADSMERVGKATKEADRDSDRLGRTLDRHGKSGTRTWRRFGGVFSRMDRTVRAVLLTILAAGPEVAALGSALSGALIAIASVGAYAVAALAPLAGIIAPLGAALAAAIVGFQDFDKYASGASVAMKQFGASFKSVAVPAFFDAWKDSLESFFQSLSVLNDSEAFRAIGEAVARMTDAFTELLSSQAMVNFMEALKGPLADALGSMGEAVAALSGLLLDFFTASAPYAAALAESFKAWAENLRAAFDEAVRAGEFATFMENAQASLTVVLELAGALKTMLGGLFAAGNESGRTMLSNLTAIIERFNTWMDSAEGQNSLATFFEQSLVVMSALGGLIGDVWDMLKGLVTESSVESLVSMFASLGDIIEVVGTLLSAISGSGLVSTILDTFSQMLTAAQPVINVIGEVLGVLAGLIEFITPFLIPVIQELGYIMEPIAAALQVWAVLFEALSVAMAPMQPVIQGLLEKFAELAPIWGEQMAPALESLSVKVAELAPKFEEFANAMGPVIEKMLDYAIELLSADENAAGMLEGVNLLVGAMEVLLNILTFLAPVMGKVIEFMIGFHRVALTVLRAVVGFFSKVGEVIRGFFSKIGEFFGKIGEFFGKVGEAYTLTMAYISDILTFLGSFVTAVKELFMTLTAPIVEKFLEVKEKVAEVIGTVVATIQEKFSAIATWFDENVITPIKDAFSVVATWFNDNVIQPIKSAFDTVKTWFEENVVTPISNVLEAFKTKVSEVLESVKTFFEETFEAIKTTVETKFNEAKAKVEEVFGGIADWVKENVIDKVTDFFGGIGETIGTKLSGVKDAFAKPFIEAFNKIADAWNGTIGKWSVSIPDWVPEIGGKTWSMPNMPKFYRQGGIANSPSIFGEAGREAAVPLDLPLSQVDPSVRWLAAIAQGKELPDGSAVNASRSVTVGEVTVVTPASDPVVVAEAVVNRIVADSYLGFSN